MVLGQTGGLVIILCVFNVTVWTNGHKDKADIWSWLKPVRAEASLMQYPMECIVIFNKAVKHHAAFSGHNPFTFIFGDRFGQLSGMGPTLSNNQLREGFLLGIPRGVWDDSRYDNNINILLDEKSLT